MTREQIISAMRCLVGAVVLSLSTRIDGRSGRLARNSVGIQGHDHLSASTGHRRCGISWIHLCERLLASGTAVVCLDDLSTGTRDNVAALVDRGDFELIEHDVTEPFPKLPPVDLVCHLASPASPADSCSRLGCIPRRCRLSARGSLPHPRTRHAWGRCDERTNGCARVPPCAGAAETVDA